MNELRINPLNGKKIIFCPDRMKRPRDIKIVPVKEKKKFCPFCPGNEDKTPPEIFRLGEKKWKTRVFKNAFPIVKPEFGSVHNDFYVLSAFGYHEIVVESPNHHSDFRNIEHIRNTIITYIERFKDLSKRKHIKYISIFKNHGDASGASLRHPHSQIMAIDFIPNEIKIELKHIEEMKRILSVESKSERLIMKTKRFVVFAPFFSESPYEVWIVPKKKMRNISYFTKSDISDVSKTISTLMKAMKSLIGDFSYNLVVKQVLKDDYHMRIMIRPRLEISAGFEIDTDAVVNTAIPEKVAELIRKKLRAQKP